MVEDGLCYLFFSSHLISSNTKLWLRLFKSLSYAQATNEYLSQRFLSLSISFHVVGFLIVKVKPNRQILPAEVGGSTSLTTCNQPPPESTPFILDLLLVTPMSLLSTPTLLY